MKPTSPSLSDLVMSLGASPDQQLEVTTDKLLLGVAGTFSEEPAHCVICRGQRGTALYSLSDTVKVNGREAAVHWLQLGDSIELIDGLRLMIEQLQADPEAPARPAVPQVTDASTSELQAEVDPDLVQPEALESEIQMPPALPEPSRAPQDSATPYSYADDTGNESILALGLQEASEEQAPAAQITLPPTNAPVPAPADAVDGAAEPPQTHSQGAGAPSEAAEAPNNDSALSPLAASLVAELTSEDSVAQESAAQDSVAGELSDGDSEAAQEPAAKEPVRKKSPTDGLAAELIRDLTIEREREAAKAAEEAGSPAENESPEPAQPTAESVADVLARMQESGQLDDVPDLQMDAGSEDEPEPEPPQAVEPPPAPTPLPSFDSEEVDVSGYMNQLLSRMSGGAPEVETPAAPAPVEEAEEVELNEFVQMAEPENPLSPEEFKPKQKAEPVKSLDAMRELANETARSAVKQSNDVRRQALGKLQIGIGVASFGLSLYYLTVGSKAFGDVPFLAGVTCLGVSGFLAYRFYGTILHNERVEEAAIRQAQLKQAAEEAGEDLPEELPEAAQLGQDSETASAVEAAEATAANPEA